MNPLNWAVPYLRTLFYTCLAPSGALNLPAPQKGYVVHTVYCLLSNPLKEIKWHSDDSVISHLSPSISSTYGGGPLRTGGLGTRTVGYPVSGFGNIGTEFGLRESNAQMEDLKRKLKMVIMSVGFLFLKGMISQTLNLAISTCISLQTTELCAKQDAYYREVVSELENRLKETVAGRDHVLTLR